MGEVLGFSELKGRGLVHLAKALLAEWLGTMFIVLIGCGSAVRGWQLADDPAVVRVAFAFGLTVATVVEIASSSSGGHVNPAVTLAMLITRKIKLIPALLYVAVQLIGGLTGAGILYALTPSELRDILGQNALNTGLRSDQGVGVEFLVTALLVLTVLVVTDENKRFAGSPSLAIGVAVTTGHLFSVKFTGCGMNPARVLGPAAVTGAWENHWVYWIGECSGAVCAAIFYLVALASPASPDDDSMFGKLIRTIKGRQNHMITTVESKDTVSSASIDLNRIHGINREP